MFGKKMSIKANAGTIHLKPFEKEEIANKDVCQRLSDYEVTKYILMIHSPTIKDQDEWWEWNSKSKRDIIWGIYLDDSELLGTTSLSLDSSQKSAETGFMLFNKAYWGKGIASASHIARTYFAVHLLNLKNMTSGVFSPNLGSLKALQSVGYFITGYTLSSKFIDGQYRNSIKLQWIHPEYKELILQDEIPKEIVDKLDPALKLAQKTLQKAKKQVVF